MTVFEGILLGILQGLTEFLPVSSSGHLYLASEIFSIEADLAFFVWLHFGTLLAVMVFYRKQVLFLVKHPGDRRVSLLILASIPTFIIAAIYKFAVPSVAEKYLLTVGFAVTLCLLIAMKFIPSGKVPLRLLKSQKILIVGAVQGFAAIPGLSRSGSTITALCALGIRKEEACEFSFLLSIPVIIAGAAVETIDIVLTPPTAQINVVAVLLGVIAAALSGFAAISVVKKLVVGNRLSLFALYMPIPLLISILLL